MKLSKLNMSLKNKSEKSSLPNVCSLPSLLGRNSAVTLCVGYKSHTKKYKDYLSESFFLFRNHLAPRTLSIKRRGGAILG